VFDSLDKTPGEYSSKLEINLDRDMPSHTALSSALIYNLDIMEKNEIGIMEDIDIEFLHDFRIAGRRSRSVLGQVRDVFPRSPLGRYKNFLSWLS
ncbi:MAG: CHAD domain-containing protein, partial [Candidatus Dadabacteria bacterium]|nr:CHAD domain-containing protein [Candidatus Dadabacteria bacterium]